MHKLATATSIGLIALLAGCATPKKTLVLRSDIPWISVEEARTQQMINSFGSNSMKEERLPLEIQDALTVNTNNVSTFVVKKSKEAGIEDLAALVPTATTEDSWTFSKGAWFETGVHEMAIGRPDYERFQLSVNHHLINTIYQNRGPYDNAHIHIPMFEPQGTGSVELRYNLCTSIPSADDFKSILDSYTTFGHGPDMSHVISKFGVITYSFAEQEKEKFIAAYDAWKIQHPTEDERPLTAEEQAKLQTIDADIHQLHEDMFDGYRDIYVPEKQRRLLEDPNTDTDNIHINLNAVIQEAFSKFDNPYANITFIPHKK
jgi:hypothetical protein